METSAITAGTAVTMLQASSREGTNLKMVKQAADAEKQVANMIASVAGQQKSNPAYNFSVYA